MRGSSINISHLTDLVTATGVVIAVYQLAQARRARQHELANLYVQRFWDIDDLRQRATQAGKSEELDVLDLRYLRLCEDEFEIARAGLLDPKIWAVWHGPIVEGLRDSKPLREAHPREFVLAQRCLAANQHEPSECPAIIGRLRPNPYSRHRWWGTRTARRFAALLRGPGGRQQSSSSAG